jgi:hypothetical protein
MQDFTLSLAVLATIALVWGGIWMIRKGGDSRKGMLMIAAALVLLGNVLIIAWPAS